MKKAIAFFICLCFTFMLHAQNALIINEKNGTLTSIPLKDIIKLTFIEKKMFVDKSDGTTNSTTLGNIKLLCFDEATKIDQKKINLPECLILFPNPVTERLTINFQSFENNTLLIDFIDLQGKVVYSNAEIHTAGIHQFQVNAFYLSKGIYICRLNNRKTIKTIKFIKN